MEWKIAIVLCFIMASEIQAVSGPACPVPRKAVYTWQRTAQVPDTTAADLAVPITSGSIGECAQACTALTTFRCQMYAYSENDQRCVMYGARWNTFRTAAGYQTYLLERCDCQFPAIAIKKELHWLNPDHVRIVMKDQSTVNGIEECMLACTRHTPFTCKGIDFSRRQPFTCILLGTVEDDLSQPIALEYTKDDKEQRKERHYWDYYDYFCDATAETRGSPFAAVSCSGTPAKFFNIKGHKLNLGDISNGHQEPSSPADAEACKELCLAYQVWQCVAFAYDQDATSCALYKVVEGPNNPLVAAGLTNYYQAYCPSSASRHVTGGMLLGSLLLLLTLTGKLF